MSWFFVDDQFPDCEKLELLPPKMLTSCVGLWTLAGAWSRRNLTGGDVPSGRVTKLGGTIKEANLLVSCGLWEKIEGGYRFHDWADWQETPEEVEDKRARARARTSRWREKKSKRSRGDASRDAGVTRHHDAGDAYRDAYGDARVPGEGEGEGTCKVEARSKVLGVPVPLTGNARLDRINADLGLRVARSS